MKNLYLILLILSLNFNLLAQYCTESTSLSDRDFDWRQDVYTFYVLGAGGNNVETKSVCSPYQIGLCNPFNQLNTNFLASQNPDFQDQDGWILINYFFGTPSHPTNNPYLMVYNKYESKLRVFYWINSSVRTDINEIKLQLSFVRIGTGEDAIAGYVSALLEHQNTPMRPIEGYTDNNIIVLTPQYYHSLADGIWLMTDIPVAYDPCTCEYGSALGVHAIGSGITNISLTGQGIGTLNEIVDGSGNVNTDNVFANANKINDGLSKGNAAYKSISDFTSNIDKLLVRRTNAKIDDEIKNQLNELGYGDELTSNDIEQIYEQSRVSYYFWGVVLNLG